MNQKEYKAILQGPKEDRPEGFFYYRNLAEKILGYKRRAGVVIHHLRDTKEQQEFNDKYYERWGIDFDGQMKYCVLVTLEEHKQIHTLSEETRRKISMSVSIAKTKLTDKQRKEHKQKANKDYRDTHKEEISKYKKEYYKNNSEKIKETTKKNRQQNPEKHNESNRQWKIKNREKYLKAKHEQYLRRKARLALQNSTTNS